MISAREEIEIATAQGAACAILGLLAYRAGCGFAERPPAIRTAEQLNAWQEGWQVGYDSEKLKNHRQAYNLARATQLKHLG